MTSQCFDFLFDYNKTLCGQKREFFYNLISFVISVPPIIRKGPQAKQAEEGDSVSFSCQVTGTSYPVTTVIWRKDQQYIKLVGYK